MSKKSRRHNKELARPAIEELEPRILYSADLLPVDAAVPAALHESLPESASTDSHSVQGPYPLAAEASGTSTSPLGNILIVDESSQQRHELVIIDSSVPDYQTLVDGIRQGQAEDTQLDIILLDSETASIQQVSNLLAQYKDLSAVHLISHGSDGQIQLGESIIDARTLADNQKIFAAWGDAFSTDGDFLIYGCNLAATDDGKALVDSLAELTGADVAASDDLTGDAAQGGDWELEYRQGAIETDELTANAPQSTWNYVLVSNSVADDLATNNFDGNTGLSNWSGPWFENDASGSGSNSGNVQVVNAEISLHANASSITREANLSGATSATFSFDYRTGTGNQATDPDSVAIEVSADGGSTWQLLEQIQDPANASGSRSYDISSYTAANTQIRFRVDNAMGGPNDYFYVDNVSISYTSPGTAPTNITLSQTTQVAITNAGFEAQSLADNTAVADSVSGWTVSSSDGKIGVWNPVAAMYPTEAPEGQNVAFINVAGWSRTLSQTLGETFEANRSYTLSAWVGDETPAGSSEGWEIRLYAGSQLLGKVTNADYDPADGEFVKATLHLDADTLSAYSGNYGDALTIELYNVDTGSSANVHFDDVQLEYTYLNVADGAANGTIVGDVASVSDPNSGDTFTYSLFDDAGGRFAIDSNSGIITVANGSLLNYATNSSHAITVRATDQTGLTYDEVFTVQVRPPINSLPASASVNEDSSIVFSTANGNLVSVQSDNPASTPMDVTLSVSHGSLTLSQKAGLTFISGDGTADASMRITGTQANINAALDGLSYTPTANYNGAESLQISSWDDAGLLGYYSFDNTGNLGADTGPGTANNGTVTGATSLADATHGNVLNLSATADEVRVNSLLGQPSNVTLAAWVNMDASATTPGDVISLGDAIALRVDEYGGKGVTAFYYDGSNWQEFTSNIDIKGTGWHHVAFTFDDAANTQKLYIDGVEQASGAFTTSISYTSPAIGGGTLADTTLGRHADPDEAGFTLKGQLDDARIYDRALTATEIQNIMAAPMDASVDSVAITVNAVNDAPSLSAFSQDPTYTKNGASVGLYTFVSPNIFDSGEGQTIEEVQFTVTNVTDSAAEQIVLDGSTFSLTDTTSGTTATNGYGYAVSLSGSTATITLTTTGASTADISNLLISLSYQNASEAPSTANRVFTITSIKDSGGTANGGVDTANPNLVSTVTVVAVNDAPVGVDEPGLFSNELTSLNPYGYWRLGESSGTTATDLGSGGNDGTYQGVTLGAAGSLSGDANTSADFDGANDYVDLGNFNTGGTGLTLMAWFNADNFGRSDQRIISKANGPATADHTWMLSNYDNGGVETLRFRLDAGGTAVEQIATSSISLNPGQWYFAVATYDAGTGAMVIYLDGEVIGATTHPVGGAVSSSAKNVYIGANPDDIYAPFDGRIDEAAVFDKALTATEIQRLYQAGSNVYVVDEDTALSVATASGVLINDSDADGDALTVNTTPVTNVSNGALTLNADGSFTYTPDANFSGTDSFVYEISDGNGGTAQAIATITVVSTQDPPNAVDDRPSLAFDGVDDFVQIADSPALTMSATMTMEAWFNPDAGPNSEYMILNKEGEYEFAVKNGTLQWAFANTDPGWSWYDTGYAVAAGDWTHAAISYNNGVIKTYVNGALVDTYNGSGTIGDAHASYDELRIGGRTNNPSGKYFDGYIADVRVWNTVRTDAEILANYNLTLAGSETGLVGNWLLNDGSGTTATDQSFEANHGLLGGGAFSQEPSWHGYFLNEDTTYNVAVAQGLLANDFDVDGDGLTVNTTPISDVSNGTLTLNADGSFSYTPDADFHGVDSFTYEINDGNGGSDTATVTLIIDSVNDAPAELGLSGELILNDGASDQYASVSNFTDFPATSLTIEMSFTSNVIPASGVPLISYEVAAANNEILLFATAGGNLEVLIKDNKVITGISTASLMDGANHDLSFNWTSGTGEFNIYIDGVLQATGTLATGQSITAGGTFLIGQEQDAVGGGFNVNQIFSGSYDYLRIFDDVRNSTEVANNAGRLLANPTGEAGLIGNWEMNSVVGGVVVDRTGNHDLVLSTGAQHLTSNSIVENSAPGSIVGHLYAMDPDATSNFSYTLISDPSGFFELDGGVVQLAAGANLDHETLSSHNLLIEVDDGNGLTYQTTVTVTVTDVNESPSIATNTGATVSEGSTANVITTAMLNEGDVDDDGAGLTYTLTSAVGNGTLKLSGSAIGLGDTFTQAQIDAGLLTYDHNGSETKTDSFDFSLADGGEDGTTPVTGTFNLIVTAVNDAPVASNDSASTDEDTVLNVAAPGVLANDSDADITGGPLTTGHTLSYDAANDGDALWNDENGSGFDWTMNNLGTDITYTSSPATALPGITAAYQFTGTGIGATAASFETLAGDPTSGSASFELWVRPNHLTGQQMLLDAGGDFDGTSIYLDGSNLIFASVDSGGPPDQISVDLSGLYADPTSEFLQIVATIDFAGSQMELFVDGTSVGTTAFSGTEWAGLNQSGLGQVNGSAAAGSGNFDGDVAIVRFYESALTAPQVNDNYQAIAVTPLAVSEVEGNAANVGAQITLASGALLTMNADGSYSYDPNGQFDHLGAGDSTTDSFSYTVSDGALTDTATVTITVNGLNDAPTAANHTVTTNEDTTYTFSAADFNFSDVDGDTLVSVKITTLENVGALKLGTLDVGLNQVITKTDIDAGNLKFIPVADANGAGYDSFGFSVNDGTVESAVSYTMNIDVTAVNDSPTIATNTGATVSEGSTANVITTAMLNEGDVDDSGTDVTYQLMLGTANGRLLLDGAVLNRLDTFTQADIDAGRVSYKHSGSEDTSETIKLRISDGGENSASPLDFDFNLTITPGNDSPIAVNDPSGNTFDLASDADTIGYWKLGESSGATIAIDSSLQNNDGTYSNVTLGGIGVVSGNTSADFEATTSSHVNLGNLDVAGTGITMSAWINAESFGTHDARIISKAENVWTQDHSWMLSTFRGDDSNIYLRMRVSAGGQVDTLIASTGALQTGQWHHVASTYDQTTGTMSLYLDGALVEQGQHSVGGAVDQHPARDVWIGGSPNGSHYFDGRIDEVSILQRGLSNHEIGSLAELTPPDYSVNEHGTLSVSAASGVLQNDSDVEGNTLTVNTTPTIDVTHGTLTLGADGSFTYIHDGSETTSDSFTYQVSDGNSVSTATATITITPVNDAPVNTVPGAQSVDEDTLLAIAGISVNDVDGNLSTVQLSVGNGQLNVALSGGATISAGSNGSNDLTLSGTQADINATLASLSYQGNLHFNGADTLTVLSTDGDGATDSDTVTITVNPVNDEESLDTNTGLTLNEGATATITAAMLATSDVDNTAAELSYSVTTLPSNGQLELTTASGFAISSFTQDDIDNNRLVYVHNGTETTTDSFDFTVNDLAGAGSSGTFSISVTLVNENAPVITAAQSFSVSELASNGASLGTVAATDVDTATTLSAWTITAGNADGVFAIDGATGELTIADNTHLDFDTTASYILSLTVTDGTHTSAVETVTVNITDVATAITAAQSFTIAEDVINTDPVGTVVTTGDTPKTFSIIAGNVGGAFTIDNAGNITVADSSAIDYETLTSYTLTVQASDGTTPVSETVTVDITDINENTVGAVSDSDAALDAVAENAGIGDVVGITALATDPDGTDTVSYSLSDDAGGLFTIDSGTGVVTVAAALDAETATSHSITVLATSTDTSTSSQSYAITITDVDEFDVGAISDVDGAGNTVAENAGIGDTVGITASASDSDVDDNITYSLSDDAGGLFTIDGATGVVTVASALDYESATSHNITVLATSDDASTSSQLFTITISDVNDNAPVITAAQSFSVSELAANSTSLGNVVATDVDTATTLSAWTITAGNADGIFAIDGATGELTIADNTNLDFDTTASYILSLTVSDGTNTSAVETVTVNITDVATAITAAQSFTIAENVINGAAVGSVVTTGDAPKTFTITAGNVGGAFTIDNSGNITVADASAIDYETLTSYTLTVQASDGTTPVSETVGVTITDINENTVGAVSDSDVAVDAVAENAGIGDVVGITASATDPDGTDTVSYSLSDDAGGRFTIDSGTGVVTVAAALDAETATSHSITVLATSTDTSTASQSYTITITDVDEFDVGAVTDTDGAANTIAEDAGIGDTVGITASASDSDIDDNITYSLSDDAGGLFTIDSATGVVTVASALDYETATSHNITVLATSDDTSTASQIFTITVSDVNDNAPVITPAQSFSVSELAANSTSLGNVIATDADTATTLAAWTISAGNADGIFAIDGATGELTIADNTNLDFDTTPSYTLSLTVSDGTNTSAVETVVVSVADENDNAPVISAAQQFSVNESAASGTVVGSISASDVDTGTLLSDWRIVSGNSAGVFSIDAATGEITVTDPTALDFETTNNYDLGITVSDGVNTSATETIAIFVTNTNELPLAVADSLVTDEDSAVVTQNVLNNDDVGDAPISVVSFNAVSDQGGDVIYHGDGTFTYTPPLDFNGVDGFIYTIADASGDVSATTVSILVNAVNDAPVASVDHYVFNEDELLSVDVTHGLLSNDSDVDADTLTALLVGNPASGTVILNPDGSFTYQASPDFNGVDQFIVEIQDGQGGVVQMPVVLEIQPVNDAPAALASQVIFPEDNEYVLQVNDFGFTDIDGDLISGITIDQLPAHGLLTLNGKSIAAGTTIEIAEISAGHLRFMPEKDAFGDNYAQLNFKVFDGELFSEAAATLTLNVTAVDDAPVIKTPGKQVASTDAPITFSSETANSFNLDDLDSAQKIQTIVVEVTAGELIIPATSSSGQIEGNRTQRLEISGNIEQLNQALDGLVYQPRAGFVGDVELTMVAGDHGEVIEKITLTFAAPVIPASLDTLSPQASNITDDSGTQDTDKDITTDALSQPALNSGMSAPELASIGKPKTLEIDISAFTRRGVPDAIHDSSSELEPTAINAVGDDLSFNVQVLKVLIDRLNELQAEDSEIDLATLDLSILKDGLDLEPLDEAGLLDFNTGEIVLSGVTVGTILWVLRASGFLSSLLLSYPAWRNVDPLPVLSQVPEDEDLDEDSDEFEPRTKKKPVSTSF